MEIWSILSQNEAVIRKELTMKLIQWQNLFDERKENPTMMSRGRALASLKLI